MVHSIMKENTKRQTLHNANHTENGKDRNCEGKDNIIT